MGNPYLNSDETILLATHNVISSTVRSDVILTNQRLILSDSSHTQFRPRTLPLAVIQTVTRSETTNGEPIISLSIATAEGATQPMDLVFSQKPREQRKQESDEWMKKLGEQAAMARDDAAKKGISLTDLIAAISLDDTPEVTLPDGTTPVTPYPKKGSGKACRRSFPRTSSSKFMIFGIAAIIIVIIAVLAGAYIHAGSGLGKQVTPIVPTTTATTVPTTVLTTSATAITTTVVTTVPTTPPVTTPASTPTAAITIPPTPTPVVTSVAVSPSGVLIPPTGVWIRVEYPENAGNFVGSVGPAGRQVSVNATGVWMKQIPAAQTDILDISVKKQSGTGDRLTINVYNNGVQVKSGTTTVPFGTVELHFSLKPVLSNESGS
ncbi:MAG: hypothetical protein PHF64_12535 [Methanoregula sp.]|nr:hypothetical protein [Methanoregula sp.]